MCYYIHGSYLPSLDDMESKSNIREGKKTIEIVETYSLQRPTIDIDTQLKAEPVKYKLEKMFGSLKWDEGFEHKVTLSEDGNDIFYFQNNPILCELEKIAKEEGLDFVENV